MANVACTEYARCEADNRAEHDEDDVEVINEKVGAWLCVHEKQQDRGQEREKAGHHIQSRRQPVTGKHGERGGRKCRDGQHQRGAVEEPLHRRSPRKRSSACTSTESKRSRMRNRKMPMTIKAINTEKATLISTTRGIPLAPVAAR